MRQTMATRVFSALIVAMGLGACAPISFSNSSSKSQSPSGTDNASHLPNINGSSQFVADGLYYALAYKTACADGGPIAIILVSNGASKAVMTRQSCMYLSVPTAVDVQMLQMNNSLMIHDGLNYILFQN